MPNNGCFEKRFKNFSNSRAAGICDAWVLTVFESLSHHFEQLPISDTDDAFFLKKAFSDMLGAYSRIVNSGV